MTTSDHHARPLRRRPDRRGQTPPTASRNHTISAALHVLTFDTAHAFVPILLIGGILARPRPQAGAEGRPPPNPGSGGSSGPARPRPVQIPR